MQRRDRRRTPRPATPPAARPRIHPSAPPARQAPGRDLPHPATNADQVIDLQRSAGNAAVTVALTQPVPVMQAGPAIEAGPATRTDVPVQTDPTPGAPGATTGTVTWIAPAEVTLFGQPVPCTDKEQVAAVLRALAIQLREQGGALDTDAETALLGMADKVDAEVAKYAVGGALEAGDPAYLTGYVDLARSLASQQLEAAVSRFVSQLSFPAWDQEGYQKVIDDLNEQSHLAFIASNQDALATIVDTVTKAKDLNGKIGGYTEKVESVKKQIGDVKGLTKIFDMSKKIQDLNKAFGEQVDEAKKVVDVVHDIAILTGVTGTSNGTTMMEGINQFEATMRLLDKTVGKFGKAVPVFGDLWTKWYKPMTDACIAALKKIAKYDEREGRELEIAGMMIAQGDGSVVRDGNGAPVLTPAAIAGGYFPGGQAVFSYVYGVRQGATPALTAEVRDFFLDRKDLFNVQEDEQEKVKEGDWSLFSPSSWFRSGRKNNVGAWVASHIDKVWGVLYGDIGRFIPH